MLPSLRYAGFFAREKKPIFCGNFASQLSHLQNDVGPPWPLQCPLAVRQRAVARRVAGALDDVARGLEVEPGKGTVVVCKMVFWTKQNKFLPARKFRNIYRALRKSDPTSVLRLKLFPWPSIWGPHKDEPIHQTSGKRYCTSWCDTKVKAMVNV